MKNISIDIELLEVGVILSLTTEEGLVATDAMSPTGIISGSIVALVGDVVGDKRSLPVDKGNGVIPNVHDAGVTVIIEHIAINICSVGKGDDHVAEGCKAVLSGVKMSGVGSKRHALMGSLYTTVEYPNVAVIRIARTHAGRVFNQLLGAAGNCDAQK